ncbi:hypothetical protein [Sphingomonas sp.]|uniref:hypothetical protein n=1 Tax=Sphingomonas sp. TaxID=28214 RepID=UPI00286B8E12|nr:hypothetical protein [Sphingomonas sp.]
MMLALLLALADLTGFYASSQTEVAAAIELEADGKFAYALDYGAVSEVAEGSWTSEGTTIYLTSTRTDGVYKQAAFNREPLTIDGGALLLKRYDIVIRFNRDDSLPTPPNRNKKL